MDRQINYFIVIILLFKGARKLLRRNVIQCSLYPFKESPMILPYESCTDTYIFVGDIQGGW